MLECTFIHLPGIGHRLERRLWDHGIADWSSALDSPPPPGISQRRWDELRRHIEQSALWLRRGDHRPFAAALPQSHHWRALPNFRRRIAYLDIETTGPSRFARLTVAAVYDGVITRTFIAGENLEQLPEWLEQYAIIVTFNGSCFDLPVLRRHLPSLALDQLHVDLRFLLRRLGIAGGLKSIERRLGIARSPEIDGLTGEDAVYLWHRYEAGDDAALDLLIKYNAADVQNLEPLAEFAYRQLWRRIYPHARADGPWTTAR